MLSYWQTSLPELNKLQTSWKSQLDPILGKPILQGLFLKDVVLTSGPNTINTLLDELQQGYIITSQNASASIYRSKPFNAKTLELTSNATVTIDIWIF